MTWIQIPQGNYQAGRGGKKVEFIVLHWIVGKLAAADAVFKNAANQTSAHYAIGGTEVHQYVSEINTAYHAGNFDVNQRSVGIEHEGGPNLPISEATYKTSAKLVAEIAKRHGIPLDRAHVKGHREIKATQCPGTLDIDRVIRDAKAIGTPPAEDAQAIIDKLREERDTNWRLYDAEKKKREQLAQIIKETRDRFNNLSL